MDEVLWEGDGWQIINNTDMPDTTPAASKITATHVGCDLNSNKDYPKMSWFVDDECFKGLRYQACYECMERVPDSVITLMTLYIGGE